MLIIQSACAELIVNVKDDGLTDIDMGQAITAATDYVAQQFPGEDWKPVDVQLVNYDRVRVYYRRPFTGESDLDEINAHYARLARVGDCCPPALEPA